ncbi:MAG: glycosyltransferase family 4 protein [Cyanobacteria bacterium]|nr:glycosyltransferase family 4 protein [Cyanobacteriota bacterium]
MLTDSRLKLAGIGGWNAFSLRNQWFQEWTACAVSESEALVVFSYSYTARLPFTVAKARGGICILGQIDPGPREFDIVDEHTSLYQHLQPPSNRPASDYWRQWEEEIALADWIVVNSTWSSKLLLEAGVPAIKLVEIPLVYEPSFIPRSSSVPATTKSGFKRIKLLFLGSVILRKGVGQLFDAIKLLVDQPVDFTFAGPIGVKIPEEISSLPNVRFLGPVNKRIAEGLYRESDVFLFPTLSDGFGLTQLEALGHGLPVIASENCARVIEDRVNGLVLTEVKPESIAEAILHLVRNRQFLAMLQANAFVPDQYHPRHLSRALLALEQR